MAHVQMSPAQHSFSGHCLTAPAAISSSTTTTSSSSNNNGNIPNQDSAQRCMAMLSQELASVNDRDVPSQAEVGAASTQGSVPYPTPSQSTHVNVMVARTIRAAIAGMRANGGNNNNG